MLMLRILICGGRKFGKLPASLHPTYHEKRLERDWGLRQLDKNFLDYDHEDISVIHGGATGGDDIGREWAEINKLKVTEFKANWELYGKRAGFIRNTEMLREGKPNFVSAFPGGTGTNMMCSIAEEAGVLVKRFTF